MVDAYWRIQASSRFDASTLLPQGKAPGYFIGYTFREFGLAVQQFFRALGVVRVQILGYALSSRTELMADA